MKLKPSTYFIIVILLLSLATVLGALTYKHPQTRLLPLIIGGIVFALSAAVLIRELRTKGESKKRVELGEAGQWDVPVELSRYRRVAIWIAVYALAIWVLGFFIAVPLFILSYLKSHRRGWLTAIVIAGLTIAFIYVVFDMFLQVKLYPGLLYTSLTR